MNSFVLKIWDDETSLVTFYTVHRAGEAESETDQFYLKFQNHPQYGDALQELNALLFDTMGEEFGASKYFFSRHENAATALPPSKVRIYELTLEYPGFPLRLYCYRISDQLVVLFNGDVKNVGKVQESPRLSMLFHQANHYVRKIEESFKDGILECSKDGRFILDFQGNTEITIY